LKEVETDLTIDGTSRNLKGDGVTSRRKWASKKSATKSMKPGEPDDQGGKGKNFTESKGKSEA